VGGGGVFCDYTCPVIRNCIFYDNIAVGDYYSSGGAILVYATILPNNPTIASCSFYNNISGNSGGGAVAFVTYQGTEGHIVNSIIWGNSEPDLLQETSGWGPSGHLYVDYSLVTSGWNTSPLISGEHNIVADPCFVDAAGGDFHLKSQAGRYNPNTQSWVADSVTSLCIDAGDPADPVGLEPFPNGGIINMGAYGGTAQASKSYFGEPVCNTIVAGDINGDCIVNLLDLVLMSTHWLEDYSP